MTMSELSVKDLSRGKKRKLIAFTTILGLLVASVGGFLLVFGGELFGDDQDITWQIEKGDVFYLKMKDDYYWTESDEEIRSFSTILKSEILKTDDLSIDLDNDTDLTIMSSFLAGRDDFYSVEVPNYFDLYQLLLGGYDIYQLIKGISAGSPPDNGTSAIGWDVPSAIHVQSSGVYHELIEMIDLYNISSYGSLDFPSFNSTYELIEFIAMNSACKESFYEDFEDSFVGDNISPFSKNFPESSDNNATISEWYGNNKLNLTQFHDHSDPLKVSMDLFDDYLNYERIAERVDDLSQYIYQPEDLYFHVTFDHNLSHTFETKLISDHFNLTKEIDGIQYNYTGYNGLHVRFKDGYLQYCQGDYYYEEGSLFPPELGNWQESSPSNVGWHNLSTTNFSTIFYEGSPHGEEVEIDIDIHWGGLSNLLMGDTPYAFDIDLYGGSSYHCDETDIPLHVDCPYDFLDVNDSESDDSWFRLSNLDNLIYILNDTKNDNSSDLIDDIDIDGSVYWYLQSFDNLVGDFFFSQLLLLSVYHLMFFPNEFDYESLLVGGARLLNEFSEQLFGMKNFINITNTTTRLSFLITNDTFSAIRTLMDQFFLEVFNLEIEGYVLGDTDLELELVFDKRVGSLNESILTITYKELDIYRELGLQLVAVDADDFPTFFDGTNGDGTNGDGTNGDGESSSESPYSDYYPSQPTSQVVEELGFTIVLSLIYVSLITIMASMGLMKLIQYLKGGSR